MFKLIISVVLTFILTSCSYTHPICQQENVISSVNNVQLNLEVACSLEKRTTGLMNRQWLAENDGMVFVFEEQNYHAFWMKNTLIPLSIAFVNKNMTIVDIKEMQPQDLTPVGPREKAVMAIEMNSHWYEKNKINIGDKIKFKI